MRYLEAPRVEVVHGLVREERYRPALPAIIRVPRGHPAMPCMLSLALRHAFDGAVICCYSATPRSACMEHLYRRWYTTVQNGSATTRLAAPEARVHGAAELRKLHGLSGFVYTCAPGPPQREEPPSAKLPPLDG